MRILETKVYTIEEHPNKENCFDWIRNNWHDLNQHGVDEVIDSINALVNKIGGSVSYSIGQSPDRSEHIYFKDYNHEELARLNAGDCPLTGCCWDCDLIVGLREGNPTKVLSHLHADTDYAYSDEGLFDFCEANGYEFDEDGNFIN